MKSVAKPNHLENMETAEVRGMSHIEMANRFNEIFLKPLQHFQPPNETEERVEDMDFTCNQKVESCSKRRRRL